MKYQIFVLLIGLILNLVLLTPGLADLGPKPVRDTGYWNSGELFKLAVNNIEITLEKEKASVEVCFRFISTKEVFKWDIGTLVWAWPAPINLPEPKNFSIACSVILISNPPPFVIDLVDNKKTDSTFNSSVINSDSHRPTSKFDSEPCETNKFITDESFDEVFGMTWDVEKFNNIGISRWYVVKHNFLIYMDISNSFEVQVHVLYDQPYIEKKQTKIFKYILRTGALWAGPIEHLNIKVNRMPGVRLLNSNWMLKDGLIDSLNIDPDRDLELLIRS